MPNAQKIVINTSPLIAQPTQSSVFIEPSATLEVQQDDDV